MGMCECLHVDCVYVCVFVLCTCLMALEARRSCQIPWNYFTLYGSWELNP